METLNSIGVGKAVPTYMEANSARLTNVANVPAQTTRKLYIKPAGPPLGRDQPWPRCPNFQWISLLHTDTKSSGSISLDQARFNSLSSFDIHESSLPCAQNEAAEAKYRHKIKIPLKPDKPASCYEDCRVLTDSQNRILASLLHSGRIALFSPL